MFIVWNKQINSIEQKSCADPSLPGRIRRLRRGWLAFSAEAKLGLLPPMRVFPTTRFPDVFPFGVCLKRAMEDGWA